MRPPVFPPRVNEFNIEALLLCALPYHGTNEFVRLAQTMVLANAPGWAWLSRMQQSGAALPREVLVQRCVTDNAVFRFLCAGAKKLGQRKTCSHTYLSFYAVAMCEIVAATPMVNEPVIERLLPFLVEGLAAGAAVDYRAATLMVLAELCSRASLSASTLSGELPLEFPPLDPVSA
jgi:U3 small nucleolar RNA-associated protein 10